MEREFLDTSIGSYKHRMEQANERAIAAINDGSYTVALIAIAEAMQFAACIEELNFQIECAEVNHV